MSCFNQLEKQTEIPQNVLKVFSMIYFLFGKIFHLEHCPQFKLGLLIQTPWNPTQNTFFALFLFSFVFSFV